MVYTIVWETHGRITQGYFDASIEKLVVRQSRILDLQGESEEPSPDGYLLLRWMMNRPVGETEYRHDAETKPVDEGREILPEEASLVISHAS